MSSIDTIEGIGIKYARKLRKGGIRTTEALLKRGATRKGRRSLSGDLDISEKLILEWINRADLMRVRGIGEEYSDLLEAAGVDTVKELRRRNPSSLLAKVTEINGQKSLVRRLPTASMVERWVEHAKELPDAVSY